MERNTGTFSLARKQTLFFSLLPFDRNKPQATRLPLQGRYLGATEATIFSKRGSPRKGSHHGRSFNSP
jgi:hypothetical protein